MLQFLYPYAYVDSVFSIDFKTVYTKGFRGIIFDIDNTLVHHGEDSNPAIDAFIKYVQSLGFKTFLLTDNTKERVERFIKNIDTPYIASAQKPNPTAYKKAVKMLGLDTKEILYIGDQIFTDILGANLSRIPCVLVSFMRKEHETYFGKRRALENRILSLYKKSKRYYNRLGNITKEV